MTRHTKEDALDDREYQLLLEGAAQMRDYYGQQARFIILIMGRLGLRLGEVVHMTEDWIDTRRNMIVIPREHTCTKGKGGDTCGHCRQLARQKARIATENNIDAIHEDLQRRNNPVLEPTRRSHEAPVDPEPLIDAMWSPKTEAAARDVPYDFDPRVNLCVERFFERYDEYPCSATSVGRRLAKAAALADDLNPDDLYAHCLRSTAATFHAARGLGVFPLKALMGWSSIETAQRYVTSSGENTQRALHFVHRR